MTGDLTCPKCEMALSHAEVGGIVIDHCPKCRGIWFDEHEMGQVLGFLEHHGSALRALMRGALQEDLNRRPARCPRDGSNLRRVCSPRNRKVVLDTCPRCSGIWLDGGELRELLG